MPLKFLSRSGAKNTVFFFSVLFLTILSFSPHNQAYSEPMQKENKMIKNEDKDLNHILPPGPDFLSNLGDTSVDISRLQEAESLKEIYELGEKMHIGSANDQKALTWVVYNYMIRCCGSYDKAISEIKSAGFKKIRDVTENYLKYKNETFPEYDRVIVSEFYHPIWVSPDPQKIQTLLSSLFPQTKHCRITLYFKNEQLINVHTVMSIEF